MNKSLFFQFIYEKLDKSLSLLIAI